MRLCWALAHPRSVDTILSSRFAVVKKKSGDELNRTVAGFEPGPRSRWMRQTIIRLSAKAERVGDDPTTLAGARFRNAVLTNFGFAP